MPKRVLTDAEKKAQAEYSRAYRALHRQDPEWREKESKRKLVYI